MNEEEIIDKFISDIRMKLIEGEEVTLKGIGILSPYVKGHKDKGYAISCKLYKDKNFNIDISESYESNPDKFAHGQRKWKNRKVIE